VSSGGSKSFEEMKLANRMGWEQRVVANKRYTSRHALSVQEEITGRWEGVAEIPGKKTRAIVEFTQNANQSLSATISLLDNSREHEPLSQTDRTNAAKGRGLT